jgi:uncharacterized membrane protein YeaQ/YmgE (transglycosylase-associated protein family)
MFQLIGFLIVGLLAGALARFLVPGRDRMGCIGTMLLGVAGSYVGGFLGSLIFEDKMDLRKAENFIGAVLGAVVALLIWRLATGGSRRR